MTQRRRDREVRDGGGGGRRSATTAMMLHAQVAEIDLRKARAETKIQNKNGKHKKSLQKLY
jgi:hypothetical protein